MNPQPVLDWVGLSCSVLDLAGNIVTDPATCLRSNPKRLQYRLDPDGEASAPSLSSDLDSLNGASVKYWVNGNGIKISCNPTAWLQGHAAFCVEYPQTILLRFFAAMQKELLRSGYRLDVHHFTTLHLAHMVDCDDSNSGRNALEALQLSAFKGRAYKSIYQNGMYFGQSSHSRACKIYRDANKYYPSAHPGSMGRFLRVEAVIMGDTVPQYFGPPGPQQLTRFKQTNLHKVFLDQTKTLRVVAENTPLTTFPADLSDADVGALFRWQNHALTGTREKLRMKRNRILRRTGIDIYLPPTESAPPKWMTTTSLQQALLQRIVTNAPPEMTCHTHQ